MPPYVWTPQICLDAPFIWTHAPYDCTPPIHLDALIYLDAPCMFGCPHMFGYSPVCLGNPMSGCPLNMWTLPYVWTPPICLEDVWMPAVHIQHK